MSFEPKNVSLKEMMSELTQTRDALRIACMLCGTDFEQYIPGRVWIYIFSFLETRYQSEHELFDKESTKYDLIENSQRSSSIENLYYEQRYANFLLDVIIDFHAINYWYAVSVLPLFEVSCPPYPSKSKKMELVFRRQSVERILSKLLHIFGDTLYKGVSIISKRPKKRQRDGYASKKLILNQSTPYVTKLTALNSLISVFNNSEYLKNDIPYVTQRYTFIYINGLHTPIPLPLTLEIYLGLAQHL